MHALDCGCYHWVMENLPQTFDELENWLYDDGSSPATPSLESLRIAKEVALEGWRERAAERGAPAPSDLTSACKFASIFCKALFGGEIRGNEDHQFNFLNGAVIDLSEDSADVRGMLAAGADPHRHDIEFFGNDEHLEAMLSCMPRVERWVTRYRALTVEPQAAHPRSPARRMPR